MKQTWGLKILNTSKAKINLFFPLYFNAPSLTYFKAFEKKQPDDQICPVCAFYNLGRRRRRLCSYRRAAFGRPRRLTLSSLLRTAKVLFPHFLFLHLYSSLIRGKKITFSFIGQKEGAPILSISDIDKLFSSLVLWKDLFFKKSLQYTNMYDFSLYYWIIFLRAKRSKGNAEVNNYKKLLSHSKM